VAAKKKHSKDTPEQQHARFVEAAKKAEADEAPDAMDKAFNKIDARRIQSPKKTIL
jgi:DNA-binding GntR family transcriptional regulator